MKRANGDGTVYRLNDTKRRKPWLAVVSYRDTDGVRHKKMLGSFETKAAASAALTAFQASSVDVRNVNLTFAQVFDLFFRDYQGTVSASTAKLRMISYRQAEPLHDKVFASIRATDLQIFLNELDKGTPTLEAMRALFSSLWKFGEANGFCARNVTATLKVPKREDKTNRRPHMSYTDEEINLLWQHADEDMAALQLILIYCGCRISELIELRTADIDLTAQCFTIRQAKTQAGIRTVPIAAKALQLWRRFYDRGGDVLIVSEYGNAIQYQRIRTYWDQFNTQIGIDHMPHDCRHTAISKMTAAGVDARLIKKIVGHRTGDVTEDVYTHVGLPDMLGAVNSI